MTMNLYQLPVLIRREVQEHKAAFLIAPLVVTAFLVAVMIVGFLSLQLHVNMDIRMQDDSVTMIPGGEDDMPLDTMFGIRLEKFSKFPMREKETIMTRTVQSTVSPLMIVLWLVVLFYLLGTLYDERRDRSILFWKSMPVSDGMTVTSKLIMAALVGPAIYVAAAVVIQVLLLVVTSVAAMNHDVPIWSTFWVPARLITGWMMLMGYFIFASLWCLPYYGWVLFVSSFARSLPFLWALGIPFAVVIMERMMMNTNHIGHWMARHILELRVSQYAPGGVSAMFSQLGSIEFAISLIVGVAFIYGAVWMRGRGDEI